jgi:hypothetical protein
VLHERAADYLRSGVMFFLELFSFPGLLEDTEDSFELFNLLVSFLNPVDILDLMGILTNSLLLTSLLALLADWATLHWSKKRSTPSRATGAEMNARCMGW